MITRANIAALPGIRSRIVAVFLVIFGATTSSLHAQTARNLEQETTTLTRANDQISILGTDLFGDSISAYNGTLSFAQTDVSLPGNSMLEVAVTRRFLHVSEMVSLQSSGGLFGDWDLDIPRLEGVFAQADGWIVGFGNTANAFRCSQFDEPPNADAAVQTDGFFSPAEFFSGVHLHLPGRGGQEVLRRNELSTVPNDGHDYPLTTLDRTLIRCLPTLAHGAGEGFEVLTPDGTVYRFDWLVDRPARGLTKPRGSALQGTRTPEPPVPTDAISVILGRMRAEMLPTSITDRFGHTVHFTWNPDAPRQLQLIEADDGRSISFDYVENTNLIESVSDGTRTWSYAYTNDHLTTATRPDTSAWTFALQPLFFADVQYSSQSSSLCNGSTAPLADVQTGTMTHPSGATASFTVRPQRHGRTNVPNLCAQLRNDPPIVRWANRVPLVSDVMSVESKTITGPGIVTPLTWNYDYSTPTPCWRVGATSPHNAPICDANTTHTKTVTITENAEPVDRISKHTFSTRFGLNEGKLLKVEVGDSLAWKRTDTMSYADPAGKAFPDPIGTSLIDRSDVDAATRHRPQEAKVEQINGITLNWSGSNFDKFGSPKTIVRSSSIGFSKSELVTYQDFEDAWVLGLTKTVRDGVTNTLEVENTYDPVSKKLLTRSVFGRLDETRSYHTAQNSQKGLLATRKDAANKTTSFTNYKRGIPRTVTFHDGSFISGTVSDEGWVKTYTDELGNPTTYDYDPMGRLISVVHPPGDSVAWANTTIAFAKQGASPSNLPADLWKQSITTGNYARDTHFDALWRPILVRERDITAGGTDRYTVREFDADGREVFTSYPLAAVPDYTVVDSGTHKTFDDLGRLHTTTINSELGPLTTTIDYVGGVSGHTKKITNPRGFQTEIDFMVYDETSEELPLEIRAPENTKIVFDRDAYGKPKSVTRSGNSPVVSATRRYVYDDNQRLCKTIEPERGAEVFAYDAANRIDWTAPGTNLTADFNNCQQANVATSDKIVRSYDGRDRLTGINYPDATLDEARSYFPDGALQSITRGSGSEAIGWAYAYNKRRLLERETLSIDGGNTAYLGWTYNALGHLAKQRYVDAFEVEYAPNALGQPTVVRTPDLLQTFAHTISYHVNGALANFTYGNGVTHVLTQNTRDLPLRSLDQFGGTKIIDYTFTFDENANPTVVGDGVPGNIDSKTLAYDDLDRLETATAANTFGTASMAYDALDNLTQYAVSAGTQPRDYRYVTSPTTQRLTRINNAGGTQLIGFTHDVRGNTLTKDPAGTVNDLAFTFDRANRLLDVKRNNVLLSVYRYDANGHRTKTITPSTGDFRYQVYSQSGSFLWDANFDKNELAQTVTQTSHNYIHLQGSLIAKRESVAAVSSVLPLFADGFETLTRASTPPSGDVVFDPFAPSQIAAVSTIYVHTDALGSPVVETNGSGTEIVGSRVRYEPFGLPLNSPQDGAPSYTGHQFDVGTGLVQAQQRFYDPTTGRFASTDPALVDNKVAHNFNRYAYAANSPYKFQDNDGRQAAQARYSLQAGVTLSAEVETQVSTIADAYYADRSKSITVTSGTRTSSSQADAMYEKFESGGQKEVNIYKDTASAQEIFDKYKQGVDAGDAKDTTVTAMTTKIDEQMVDGKYISKHLEAGAVDIRSSDMDAEDKTSFEAAATETADTVILETSPPHWHLQFDGNQP